MLFDVCCKKMVGCVLLRSFENFNVLKNIQVYVSAIVMKMTTGYLCIKKRG